MKLIVDTKLDDLSLVRRVLDMIEGCPTLIPEPGAADDYLRGVADERPEYPAPPPPPAVVVPPQSAALLAPPQTVAGPTLDSQGLPWDERIHSSSRELVKNGTWKLKRGVPDDLVAQVRVESRRLFPLPVVPSPAPPLNQTLAPPPPPAPSQMQVPPPPPPPAPSQTPPPPPPPAPTPSGAVTWIDLMKRLSALQGAGKLDSEAMNKLAAAYGVDKFQKLALHEQHWQSIYDTLGAYVDA